MVIDFHAHIYPEKIADKAAEYIGNFYTIDTRCHAGVNDLLQSGQAAGIDKFLVQSAAQEVRQVHSINDFIAAACAQHPQFVGFGTLHKDMEDPAGEIERILSLGLKGVKLHPDMQKFDMDDATMDEIYGLLEGRLPVLMHCGDYRTTYSHPARLANVLDKFPKLTVIAAHFGGWSVFDLALEYLEHRNCYLDVSSSMMFLGKRRSEELIRLYGPQRILFGSDFPMWDPVEELKRFNQLDFSESDRELMLYKNALRILESGSLPAG